MTRDGGIERPDPRFEPRPRLSLAQRTKIVEALLAFSEFVSPEVRQQVFGDLPISVVQQLPAGSTMRRDLHDLVRTCEDYPADAPWTELCRAIRARYPEHSALAALEDLLRGFARLDDSAGR